jgi:hypothetical protein
MIVEEILIERDNISDSDDFVRVIDALGLVDHFIFFEFFFHSILRDVYRYLTGATLTLNARPLRCGFLLALEFEDEISLGQVEGTRPMFSYQVYCVLWGTSIIN